MPFHFTSFSKINTRSILTWIIAILGALAVGAIAALLLFLPGKKSLIAYLPINQTVGFIQINNLDDFISATANTSSSLHILNTPSGSGAVVSGSGSTIPNTFHPLLQFENSISSLSKPLVFINTAETKKLIDRSILALLDDSSGELHSAILTQLIDKQNASSFVTERFGKILSPKALPDYQQWKMYSLNTTGSGSVIAAKDAILLWAQKPETVKTLINTSAKSQESVLAKGNIVPGDYAQGSFVAFMDYEKSVDLIKTLTEDDRRYRDFFTLLSPLEKKLSAIRATVSKDAQNNFALDINLTGDRKFFTSLHSGTSVDGSRLVVQPETLFAISGTDFLQGYTAFVNALAIDLPDAQVIGKALAKYIIGNTIAPSVTPEQVMQNVQGNYAFSLSGNQQGNMGFVGNTGYLESTDPSMFHNWLKAFGTASNFVYRWKTTNAVMNKDKNTSPLAVEEKNEVIKDIPIYSLATNDTELSPAISLQNNTFSFASNKDLLANQLITSSDNKQLSALSGNFVSYWNIAKLFGNDAIMPKTISWSAKFSSTDLQLHVIFGL